MKLLDLPPADATGTLLAHSQDGELDGKKVRLKKGTLLSAQDIAALQARGHASITVAQLDAQDVHEDEAALRLARAVCGPHMRVDQPFTGRANLFAQKAGLFLADADLVDRINRCDPSMTLATLPPYTAVEAGRMVATVKIIPFAVPGAVLQSCIGAASDGALSVAGFRAARVGLVATRLPTLREKIMDKTRKVLAGRLEASGSTVFEEIRTPHETAAVANAISLLADKNADLIVLVGASAMIDADDVLPQALRRAGGTVLHVGMPVDPGNLLFLGELAGRPVIGAPGCARSPVENGFDWVLNRILAGIPVRAEDISAMGVGGLLMEIVSRPQPRELELSQYTGSPRIAALLLAAGQSKRMGANNKLIAELDGMPLVRHVAEAVRNALGADLTVVTGAQPEQIEAALEGIEKQIVFNPEFDRGLSTSLRTGIQALASRTSPPDGVVVLLGDMPLISQDVILKLIAGFDPAQGREIIVPTDRGKRGNPVLWSARFLNALSGIQGDTGGRHLIGEFAEFVHEVEIGPAASFDLDTPEQMQRVGGRFQD
uniref:molybdopterin-binding/glycosyltransferase family 2 protein n=1 Tax=Pararhizobium sp. IMCC3301 TaxID=3067904 RepID=UPI0027414D73|nr:molybdopterin-binding/glycosyltransferase family 2 protein [Pararhizobium sp. IMCC3301]